MPQKAAERKFLYPRFSDNAIGVAVGESWMVGVREKYGIVAMLGANRRGCPTR